jgi:peptidoglycan/xylan/chitin deacetylase (PgdA/CDA1 family)
MILLRKAIVRSASYAAAVPLIRNAAAASAHIRGRSLVLLYHRVRPQGRAAHKVVPTVATNTLRCHIEALRRFADVVSLDELLSGSGSDRLRVAITFDDDDLATVEHAVPVLEATDVRATFFLSGRGLNGLDDYWWVRLEHLLATQGIAAVRAALKVGGDIADIAKACENSEVVRRLTAITGVPERPQLRSTEIAGLSQAGMTIGFHTLEHLVLTELGPAALEDALSRGRAALEQASNQPVRYIAYPHGRADTRVARAAAASGYRAGFMTGGRAVSPAVNPWLIPRWEPGSLPATQLTAEALLRLHARVLRGERS